jgi:hypothetical protein
VKFLDSIVIEINPPGATYTWEHTGETNPTAETLYIRLIDSVTVYTIEYFDGTNTCTDSILLYTEHPTLDIVKLIEGKICPGELVELSIESSVQMSSPTECGIVNSTDCPALGSNANERIIGNDSIVYEFNDSLSRLNPFGRFAEATKMSDILYRASELSASGMKAGKIKSITFDFESFKDDIPIILKCSFLLPAPNKTPPIQGSSTYGQCTITLGAYCNKQFQKSFSRYLPSYEWQVLTGLS